MIYIYVTYIYIYLSIYICTYAQGPGVGGVGSAAARHAAVEPGPVSWRTKKQRRNFVEKWRFYGGFTKKNGNFTGLKVENDDFMVV